MNGMMGELLIATGEFTDAKTYIAEQLAYSEELKYQKGITKAYISKGQVHFYESNLVEASKAFSDCITLSDKIKYFPSKEEAFLWQIDIALKSRDLIKAKEKVNFLKDNDELEDTFGLLLRQGKVWAAENRITEAKNAFLEVKTDSKNHLLMAAAFNELSKIKSSSKSEAFGEIEKLYNKTPHYSIKMKMDELS